MEAIAGIAFQRFVRHLVPQNVQHRAADDVFGRDQLDLILLTLLFFVQRIRNQWIGLGDRRIELKGHGVLAFLKKCRLQDQAEGLDRANQYCYYFGVEKLNPTESAPCPSHHPARKAHI